LVALVALGVMLLFLLIQATNNRELYERNYVRLFILNVVVAVLLVGVIVWALFQLLMRWHRGKFGSRLLLKLAAVFALVGFAPGVLIYVVSYQFVSRSIENWFDVKVEGALNAGLSLGRATFDVLTNDLAAKTRNAAAQLVGVTDAAAGLRLERIGEQLDASDVMLWNASGTLIASAGKSRYQINPLHPSAQQLRTVRSQQVWAYIEGLDEAAAGAVSSHTRVVALATVAPAGIRLLEEPRYLQITQNLPPALVANAVAVQEAHREYQERALGHAGLRRMYIGTLTLSLFLAVLGAVLLAVVLGNQLARPLLLMAEGVRQVAAGDLSPKPVLQGKDELRGLTRSFAEMTQQLADARATVERSMTQLDAARSSLQTILDNLTAGVIVLDREGVVLSSNPGAARILQSPLTAYQGRRLDVVPGLEGLARNVWAQFAAFEGEPQGRSLDYWQQSFALSPALPQCQGQAQSDITLVARGALLPDATRLLVFDDISEIVSAQRIQAWGEVARRLAHEIKNPLTPIRLSAERLEMKLVSKLQAPEQAMLIKSVKTIVDQVDAMKRLVNEFRDYARLPAADLKPLDLNALVQDVLQLYGAEAGEGARIQAELDPQCPLVRGDAEQLRQVIHNLVQNAQDACDGAALARAGMPAVLIRTQWMKPNARVRLSVLDQGPGFPEHILKRAFEPYVTTKTKGTGLGLAVVKKIADEHNARVDIANRVTEGVQSGAQVSLSFAVDNTQTS
jgi:nitrogen fixation/metabolism regulation signal transduction histidine kinase